MVESSSREIIEVNSPIIKDVSEEVAKKTPDKICEIIFDELPKKQHKELCKDIRYIKIHQKINEISSYYLFFKSCVLQDFQNRMESSLEKYFMQYLENSLAAISILRKIDSVDLFAEWYSFINEQDNIYSSFYKFDFDHED
jgi:hypothetical protein